jgi:hypothetical protein
MSRMLDPKDFSLPPKTILEEIKKNHIAIVISRKSRIIMADGRKILEKVEKIKEVKPSVKVSLKTTTPVCSKTIVFLKEKGIELI